MKFLIVTALTLCTLIGESWNCQSIRTQFVSMLPATPPCSNGATGTFTVWYTADTSLYNMQIQASGSQTQQQVSGTGVCGGTAYNKMPTFTPTVKVVNTSKSQWYVTIQNYTVIESNGLAIITTQPPQISQPFAYTTGQCTCSTLDCSNPSLGGQCSTTCPRNCNPQPQITQNLMQKNDPPCSPIVFDLQGTGFSFTDVEHGVTFDVFDNNQPQQISWMSVTSGNGWLALPDENGNISSFSQLFGNLTPQSPVAHPNGFLALAEYDLLDRGGNGDGRITPDDEIWNRLRIWVDKDHDGISEPNELLTLDEAGVRWISLGCALQLHIDKWGNQFRLRGFAGLTRSSTAVEIWDVWVQ